MRYTFIVILALSLMLPSAGGAQDNQTGQKNAFHPIYKASKEKVESQQYQFIGAYVYQNKTREKIEGDSNTLSIDRSRANGKITALSKVDKTFTVDGTIKGYEVNYNDNKQTIRIQFNVETSADIFDILIDIKPNGNAFLAAKNSAMETILWTGRLAVLN